MFWSKRGAEAVMTLRACYLSGSQRWHDFRVGKVLRNVWEPMVPFLLSVIWVVNTKLFFG